MKIGLTLLAALAASCAGCLDASENDPNSGIARTHQDPSPKSNVYGLGPDNIHHVVYVVDRSGSMQESFDWVREGLLRDISALSLTQDFHVIFFSGGQDGDLVENNPRRLVKATDGNKTEVAGFINGVIPAGSTTDPIPALRRAFAVLSDADRNFKGKVICLLSDGEFADIQAVIEGLRKLNASKSVVIHSILEMRQDLVAEKTLRTIAKEHSGKFKLVWRPDP